MPKDSLRFIKIQVIKLTNEHALSSRQIATYLNSNLYRHRIGNKFLFFVYFNQVVFDN